jgi:hypothetical protein
MAVDGDNLTAWTFGSRRELWFWLKELIQWWKWSPDGSLLALLLSDRLAIVRPDGREVASAALPPSTEHSNVGWPLMWSPDSSWVAGTDRDVLAVLNVRHEGRVVDLPSDFTGRNVVLTAWLSPSELQITDPVYAGRPQPDARAWVADVAAPSLQWRSVSYSQSAPPSDAELQEARSVAQVSADDRPSRILSTADGRGTAYVFSSPFAGTKPAVVTAVVVRADGALTKLAVPPSVVIVGVPRGEVSVVVVEGQ